MKNFIKYFFRGLLVVAPLFITLYVIFRIFKLLESILNLRVPGLGLVILIFFITLIGFLTTHYLAAKLFQAIDLIFQKIPLAKILYASVKDLMNAFVGEKKGFSRPVYVKLTEKTGMLGFITNDSLEKINILEKIIVYFPQSYNFAGNIMVVSKDIVEPLPIDGSDAMKFIVSGGTGSL